MAYRINGFEQIKGFYSWVFNNPDKARPTHISLYLFLLNQNNRSNWVEWFKCPYDLAMQGACIGNKGTYYKCLDDLKSWKIIDYKKGINNYKAPIVKLFQMYDNEQLTEQVTVPLSEPQTVPLSVPLTVPIYKLITDNEKLLTENIERVKVFISELKIKKTITESCFSFDEFWEMYGKKVSRKDAEKKYNKLSESVRSKIKETLPTYLSTIKDKQFQKDPTTYMNKECWNDEIVTKTTPDIPNTMDLDWRYKNLIK